MKRLREKRDQNNTHLTISVIEPEKGWVALDLRTLFGYRELFYFLTWRDIKIRYKQTILGAAWAILQPFLTMIIFSIFFGRLAEMPSDGLPYPLFCFSGLALWAFFSNGLTFSTMSMVREANTIKKIYFPRLIIPTSSIISGLVDFLLAFTVLLGMMVFYKIGPNWHVLFLPLFVLLAVITALGVGLWLSALNVLFRDVQYAVPFLVQAWLFLTPIAYPSSLLNGVWKTIYGINPMAGVIDGFRWALFGMPTKPGPMLLVSVSVSIIVFISGAYYFKRMEKVFADVV